jgi:hypothetical protein
MNNPRTPSPEASGSTINLTVHIPDDWNPVRAMGAICDLSSDYGRACEGVCPAQQEARFRDISLRLVTEAMRTNELLRRQQEALNAAKAALALAKDSLATPAQPQRLLPGHYYPLSVRLDAAAAAAHNRRQDIPDALLQVDRALASLNVDCLP